MKALADLDPNEIDPDETRYFDYYGSMPDPDNIDSQLLKEHRKNSRIKPTSNGLADVFIALILVLIAAPLVYVSVLAVIHFGWIGLIVGAILSPLFFAAGIFIAGLFQR